MSISSHFSLHAFQHARDNIQSLVQKTPLLYSDNLSQQQQLPVYLKTEMLQPTGAFKVRGAANKIVQTLKQNQRAQFVAVSTGNHGTAVAYIANQMGVPAYICLSNNVPQNKRANITQYGGELIVTGDSQDEAAVHAKRLVDEKGYTLVHPFDDEAVIHGQGTIGLELIEQLPDLATVIVPLSGGGLIGGIACVLKQFNPSIRVIGVSIEQGCAMYHSLRADRPVEVTEVQSVADSLQGGIGLDNRFTFELVKRYVDDVVLVSESDILNALSYTLYRHKMLLEGAAVVGVAALCAQKASLSKGPCVIVLSGNNVDPKILEQLKEVTDGSTYNY